MALILVAMIVGCKGKAPVLRVGQVPPAVTLPALRGGELTIPGDLAGNISVILFWAQGCSYCERGMPDLEALYRRHREKGFSFVAVQVAGEETAGAGMAGKFSLTFPMLYDSRAMVRDRYGLVGTPTMFVLGRDGALKERILGGVGAETLEEMLLKEF